MNTTKNASASAKGAHTPGPWEIHEHNHRNGEYWATIGYLGRGPVCDVTHITPCAQLRHLATDIATQQANARLIAASPRMYDYIKTQAEKGDANAAEILNGL